MTPFFRLFSFRHPAFLAVWYVAAVAVCFVVIDRLGWQYGGVFGLLGVIYPLYLLAQALALRSELRLRGYEWITLGKAYVLAARRGTKAWRLPPRDEVAGTPGYDDTLQGIEQFLLQAHDEPIADARVPQLERLYKETKRLPAAAPVAGLMRWSTSVPLFLVLMIALNLAITGYCLLTSWARGWLFFLNLPYGWGYWLLLAWALRGHLERLGYGVWSARDRLRLAYRCQLLCRRIPAARDLQKSLGTNDPITCRALSHAVMTIAWLEGKAGRTIR